MRLIRFIKEKWNKWYYHDLDSEEDELDWDLDDDGDINAAEKRNLRLSAEDDNQRTVYVLELLGQMAEASEKMEVCDFEYQAVTSLLMDIEEIEALQGPVKNDIMTCASKIDNLEKERKKNYSQTALLPETVTHIMEQNRDSVPNGIVKIREQENYRKLIKHDLKRLNAEKNALNIRKSNANSVIANSRGIAIICGCSIIICMILLFVLDQKFDMDVRIGYVLAGGIGALALTYVYVKYMDATKEVAALVKAGNKLITIHNTVKIRYINNTNLLQYLYMKYDVDSAKELEEKWNAFVAEEGARQKDDVIREELEYYYNKLTVILKQNGVKDPDIWTGQTKALYNHKEMVEVRHALIGRRQKLREQMEYNRRIAAEAKNNIDYLSAKYPQYASEVAKLVEQYKK